METRPLCVHESQLFLLLLYVIRCVTMTKISFNFMRVSVSNNQ